MYIHQSHTHYPPFHSHTHTVLRLLHTAAHAHLNHPYDRIRLHPPRACALAQRGPDWLIAVIACQGCCLWCPCERGLWVTLNMKCLCVFMAWDWERQVCVGQKEMLGDQLVTPALDVSQRAPGV